MLSQRSMLRLAQRSAPVRNAVQRRFNSAQSKYPWIVDNEFNRERANVKHHAASTSDLWRKLSIFGVIPVLIGGGLNAYNLWNEHWEHWEHMPPLEERTEYPYQNIRSKNFPWGDGDKLELQYGPLMVRTAPNSEERRTCTFIQEGRKSTRMSCPDVLIIGAGPSGLVTALWLAKQGISIRIIDKAKPDISTSRALAIQARTLELYRQLDIDEEVISSGHKVEATNIWSEGDHKARIPIGDFGLGLTPYPFIHILSQDRHERLLERRLNALGVQVERDRELIDFTENDLNITAQLRITGVERKLPSDDGDDETENCTAAFIIGCDGAHSTVRRVSGIDYEGGTYSHTFFVVDIEGSGPTINGEAHVTFNNSEFMLLFPYDKNHRARIAGAIDDTLAGKGTKITFDDIAPHMVPTLNLHIDKVNWFSTYRSHHRVAAAFRKGRAFLVGDAAHIHSPVGGQGMNTGIGDAVNLAWKLSAVVKGQAGLSLLDSYETERHAFAMQLVNTTDKMFNGAISQRYIARTVRTCFVPYVAPLLAKVNYVRHTLFRKISQIMIDYRNSTLSTGTAGRIHGGERMPWAPVGEVDNFESLESITWQVHVYGKAKKELMEWCQAKNIPLHAFPWDGKYQAVGLQADAAYLLRPDTYIAVAEPSGCPLRFDQYFEDIGLQFA
ncbi:FAD binding domain-containing protein [Aspergillus egyptiacus]|nr:FAD binding domain-containing protein [Aspergillus egyptiacus]